jgi:pimeloyl-ACP methyl ester carboxylesterase
MKPKGDEMNANLKGSYAEVNGLNMYYGVHGSGEPLILLHGGVGAIEMFGEVLPLLADGRRVVAADLQAHGRTADIDRPLSVELMADDVAALIGHLGLERADVMGYSLGGGVAVRTAIRHPEVVRKLVVVSTPFARDGWYPEVLARMGQMGPEAAEPMKHTPMYQLYAGVAPKPEDWPVLLTKLGRLLAQDYDWSEEVAAIRLRRWSWSGTPTASAPRTPCGSSSYSAAARPMPGGTDPGCPKPGSPSCPPRRTTTSSLPPRWRPPSRRSSTRPCLRKRSERSTGPPLPRSAHGPLGVGLPELPPEKARSLSPYRRLLSGSDKTS